MCSLYKRRRHQLIARVLDKLDARLFRDQRCYFGGGTAIALLHGEYRESNDLDFVVSDWPSYREIRQRVARDGLETLGRDLHVARTARMDRYGIRGAYVEDGVPIKFEIVHEGRIDLADPLPDERIGDIAVLSLVDQYATKYLANDDRWADPAVHSRDIIDIAMIGASVELRTAGRCKASGAYGASVRQAETAAVSRLIDRPEYRRNCLDALQISPDLDEVLCAGLSSLLGESSRE